MTDQLVDSGKVFETMILIKEEIDSLGLNDHEKVVVLQNLVANELNVLERKNFTAMMFKTLNKV